MEADKRIEAFNETEAINALIYYHTHPFFEFQRKFAPRAKLIPAVKALKSLSIKYDIEVMNK